MKFGIHSLLFTETFVEKDLPLLEKCKRLGFDAVELIPFDPDNFPAAKTREVARDLGLTMSQDDVDAAAAFNDSLENLRDIFEAIVTDITVAIAPAFTDAANAMTEWYKANKDWIKTKVVDVFEQTGTWNLPVTDQGKYVGFISRSKIFSSYRRILKEFSDD